MEILGEKHSTEFLRSILVALPCPPINFRLLIRYSGLRAGCLRSHPEEGRQICYLTNRQTQTVQRHDYELRRVFRGRDEGVPFRLMCSD